MERTRPEWDEFAFLRQHQIGSAWSLGQVTSAQHDPKLRLAGKLRCGGLVERYEPRVLTVRDQEMP